MEPAGAECLAESATRQWWPASITRVHPDGRCDVAVQDGCGTAWGRVPVDCLRARRALLHQLIADADAFLRRHEPELDVPDDAQRLRDAVLVVPSKARRLLGLLPAIDAPGSVQADAPLREAKEAGDCTRTVRKKYVH